MNSILWLQQAKSIIFKGLILAKKNNWKIICSTVTTILRKVVLAGKKRKNVFLTWFTYFLRVFL